MQCAWCGKRLTEGNHPVGDGTCYECATALDRARARYLAKQRSGADGAQQGAGESVIGADLMDSPDMRARPAGDRPEASGVIPCAAEGDDLSASVPARSAPSGGQQGAPVSRTGEGLIPPGVPVVSDRALPRCSSCGDVCGRSYGEDGYSCVSCGVLHWEPVWRTDAEQEQYEQEARP